MMNKHVSGICMATAIAGALFATQAGAADCGPQASLDQVPTAQYIVPMDIVQNTTTDQQLLGVVEPDGTLTVFQLVPFVTMPDTASTADSSSFDTLALAPDYAESLYFVPDTTGAQ